MSAGLLHRETLALRPLDVSVSAHTGMVLLTVGVPGMSTAVHVTPEGAIRIADSLRAAADAAERAEVEA